MFHCQNRAKSAAMTFCHGTTDNYATEKRAHPTPTAALLITAQGLALKKKGMWKSDMFSVKSFRVVSLFSYGIDKDKKKMPFAPARSKPMQKALHN